ncbi:hypothetical protein MVES1_001661 [Malassezia vespertilionis]|uniref:uncharacterized protein n=1 Tax=Malassezia vespertilionis TaxID=2020962 RepID=UPI0024B21CA9|nr:uncharacterized protein MVES1_001661 [Malassezia vespertilionis]WFD06316.1 hypothetical protein MVES1_001661 [Malassezia vespertilionis]
MSARSQRSMRRTQATREQPSTASDTQNSSESAEDAWIETLTGATRDSFTSGARSAALALGPAETERKSADIVRLALFTEYKRQSIKRDDIMKKIIGKPAARAYPIILSSAQNKLRTTFSYELVDIRMRSQENPLLVEQAAELDARTVKRPRTEERAKELASAHAYILRSTLPLTLIAKMAAHTDPPLLDWHEDGQLARMGLLYTILSIVLLHGRQISETRLRALLAQLSLSVDRALPQALQPFVTDADAMDPHLQRLTLDSYLAQLQRHGYLDKVRVQTARGHDGGVPAPEFELRWGPRAEAEVGEPAVAGFVAQLYSEAKPEEGNAIRPDEVFIKQVERAAGSKLVG